MFLVLEIIQQANPMVINKGKNDRASVQNIQINLTYESAPKTTEIAKSNKVHSAWPRR